MGYCPFYQAIPERCELFQRLRADRKLECVLSHFYAQGSRPFDLMECGEEGDVVGWIAERSGLFHSRGEVEEVLADLINLIDRACRDADPGLMDRVVFIEKTLDQIEDRAYKHVIDHDRFRHIAVPRPLFSGDSYFIHHWDTGGMGFDPFMIVTRFKIQVVAEILPHLEPEHLFDADEEGHLVEDYRNLRDLYHRVAELGEVILVN